MFLHARAAKRQGVSAYELHGYAAIKLLPLLDSPERSKELIDPLAWCSVLVPLPGQVGPKCRVPETSTRALSTEQREASGEGCMLL